MNRLTIALALLLAPALVAQTPTHLESGLQWSAGPVSNAALEARIQGALAQARAYAPIPRVAFYDLAYPRDSAEAVRLHGRGVLVVTAFSQDSTELPLTSVYVTSASGTVSLSLVTALASHVSRADTAVLATFGSYRYDAVYLFPISLRTPPADLMADFAAHRSGFRFAHFAEAPGDETRRLMALSFPPTAPPDSVALQLLKREYPDLAAALGNGSP
jgi:hypothetical protein